MSQAHAISGLRFSPVTFVSVAGLAVLAAACGASVEQGLRTRAAFDLSCPDKQLNVVPLNSDGMNAIYTYGVEGCGKKSTYVCQKNAFGDPTCIKDAETSAQ